MWKNDNGYYRTRITLPNGKRKKVYLHRLVFSETYGEIPEGFQIHHIDKDINNNGIKNLLMITPDQHKKIHDGDRRLLRLLVLMQQSRISVATGGN